MNYLRQLHFAVQQSQGANRFEPSSNPKRLACGYQRQDIKDRLRVQKAKKARWPLGHRAGRIVAEDAEGPCSYLIDLRQYSVFG